MTERRLKHVAVSCKNTLTWQQLSCVDSNINYFKQSKHNAMHNIKVSC